MNRRCFALTSVAAALLPFPAFADELTAKIARIERWSTGRISIVAQRVDATAPTFVYHPNIVVPAASTIKLVVLQTVFAAADRDPDLFGRRILLRAVDHVGGSEIFATAIPGRAYPIGDLLNAMITVSDNTAANMLITHFGMSAVNQTARTLGLEHTHLRRHFSDAPPVWRISENATTAADLATTALDIARGARTGGSAIVSRVGCERMLAILRRQTDRTKIAAGLPPGTPLGNKTGEISHVRNDVGNVDPGHPRAYALAVTVADLAQERHGNAAIARVTRLVDKRLRG